MASKLELQVIAKDQASKVFKSIRGDIKGLKGDLKGTKFDIDFKSASAGMRDLKSEAKSTHSALSNMFSIAGGDLLARGIAGAASAVAGLGRAAAGMFTDAVKSSAAMNQSVSGIGAVLGSTKEEIAEVKGLINELALNPMLVVDAQGAAEAIDMLARNGLTLDQIMAGAAESTVFLANATGGTFETSANVATDVMAMFKVRAEDMMDAVNGIVSVTVASKFSIDDYRLALAQAGGVAAALGVETEDFNTTMAATSASFAGGSDSGTSYKTFLQRLVPQSNEAASAMAQLGLMAFNSEKAMATLRSSGIKPLSNETGTLVQQLMSTFAATHDVNLGTEAGIKAFTEWSRETGIIQNDFYDVNGQLKDMADISAILNRATANLTEEQKNQYLTTIFGSDAMRTAFSLAEKGEIVYTDLKKAARELGVSEADLAEYAKDGITAFEALQATMRKTDALESARIRTDNLAGDMDILGGTIDSLKQQFGDQFDTPLRTMFQNLNDLVLESIPYIIAFGNSFGTYVSGAIDGFLERMGRAQEMSTLALQITGGDTFTSFLAGLGEMTGADVTIDADAKIVSVDWLSGAFTHTYDAGAGIQKTDVLWGGWTHVYDASANIDKKQLAWGMWTHVYDASAQIDQASVLWGAWTHTYDAKAKVDEKDVGWGFASHTYDASANVVENQIGWGLVTHTYDVGAKVSEDKLFWGLFVHEYDATGKIINTEFAPDFKWPTIRATAEIEGYIEKEGAGLNIAEKFALRFAPGVLEFLSTFAPVIKPPAQTDMAPLLTMRAPVLPADFWPSFPTFTWPTLPSWSWPTLPAFSWPTLPTWTWPTLPLFTWPALPQWTWPTIPMPGWVSSLINWRPSLPSWMGGNDSPQYQSSGSIGGQAAGTDNWKGGWTWVGEKGPELLNLPRGAQVLSNDESKKMIGQMADGNTTAAATGTRPTGNVFTIIQNAASSFKQAGEKIDKAAKTIKDSMKDLEGSLRKVPGLFGTSPVTEKQTKMAELGIPQNFADDYIRRLTDEVVNGVDWEGVDIKDAAARAGLDASLPAEAILELFTDAWNDQSLFSNPKNLELINQDAVKAALDQQAKQKLGEQNILALFGVTPEQAKAQGASAGSSAGAGMLAGMTQTLTDTAASEQIATGMANGITPNDMQPVGGAVIDGLVQEMEKKQYSTKLGDALAKAFKTYMGNAKAFADVAQSMMNKISSQFSSATGVDMVAKFANVFRAQLGTDAAIKSLASVGAKILEAVYRGYVEAAKNKDWTKGTGGTGTTTTQSTTTTSTTTTTTPVNTVPPGYQQPRSRFPVGDLAFAGAGGDNITINIYANVASAIDINEVAYKVADVIRRRR